jgi:hypothetical protein
MSRMVIVGVPTINESQSSGNRSTDLLNIFRKVLPDLETNVRRMDEALESEHFADNAVMNEIGVIQTILLELSNIAACLRFETDQTSREECWAELKARKD